MAIFALLCAFLAAGFVGTQEARAKTPVLGTAEPRYLTEPDRRDFLFDETVDARAGIVRFNAFWFQIAPTRPENPRRPDDPAYRFAALDAAVRGADARGLDVVLTLQRAPKWAERGSDGQDRGVYRPSPKAFADYSAAVARRYAGNFEPNFAVGELPRVRYYQLWNEANLNKFYAPQLRKGKSVSADNYRKLLDGAYEKVKGIKPSNKVVVAGSGPRGPTEKARTAPVEWWKDFLCLGKGNKRNCEPAKFDVFDHHPITVKTAPTYKGKRDEIFIADYNKLTKLLRKAEKRNRVGGPNRHELWATEIYWETDPPETKRGFPEKTAARYLEQGIYLLAKQKADVILNFFMIDAPLTEVGQVDNVQGGLLNAKGKRKDSFTAFRFPFVTERKSNKRLAAWGISPSAGKLKIDQLKGKGKRKKWRKIDTVRAREGKVFKANLKVKGKTAKLRARVGGEKSLVWKQRKGRG